MGQQYQNAMDRTINIRSIYTSVNIYRPMLVHCVTLVSFRLFGKILGNLREFFGQIVHRPPPAKNCSYAYEQKHKIPINWMKKIFLVCNPKIDQQDRQKGVKNFTTRNQSH